MDIKTTVQWAKGLRSLPQEEKNDRFKGNLINKVDGATRMIIDRGEYVMKHISKCNEYMEVIKEQVAYLESVGAKPLITRVEPKSSNPLLP